MPEGPLLELENLRLTRWHQGKAEPLVHDLSLRLERGESLGLVGESGSGKSLTALAVMNLLPEPSVRLAAGSVRFRGQDLRALPPQAMNALRGSRLALIVQDALAALNPLKRISQQLDEVFDFHDRSRPKAARRQRIEDCLERAGLPDTERILRSYPHELSGGMRQRLLLAMALLLDPELLIADEPTTALDLTLQARWVRQVQKLQEEQKLALLFISHDLALVAELCERIAVLYRGHLLESAPTAALLAKPQHPYTRAMLETLQRPARRSTGATARQLPGQAPGKGCPYAAQCPQVLPLCREQMPPLLDDDGHAVACHVLQS